VAIAVEVTGRREGLTEVVGLGLTREEKIGQIVGPGPTEV